MTQNRVTHHPVRKLGPVRYRQLPILSLAFIQAVARADMEIDLAALPPLISGGDRKARKKAIDEQQSSFRAPRRLDRNPWLAAYGSLAVTCGHCRHTMLIDDEFDAAAFAELPCDRCHRPVM